MSPTRGHLELYAVATVLAVLLVAVASRSLTVADRSQHQALTAAGAHFVAGIELLQAESRMERHPELNAVGYPTGRSGVLVDDADCESIWRHAMRAGDSPTAIRFVADADGGGDRCEYVLVGAVAGASMRILYWPLGVGAATVALGHETIRVTRGTHVHVELGQASS
jgi:hypothetical protein